MDKFTVARKISSPAAFRSIQVRVSTFEMINQIQKDTGASYVDLIDAMVKFCAERLDVVDEYEC